MFYTNDIGQNVYLDILIQEIAAMDSRIPLICLLSILLTTPAFASSVSGFVREPSNRPAIGAIVIFSCPAEQEFPTTSDQNGRYRVSGLPDVQWCYLTVSYQDKSSGPVRINSGSGSKDINIKLQNAESGWTITL